MRRTHTMSKGYFDALYACEPDPWKFASSAYEKQKYATTLAALPKARYARALEVGCSIGVLTGEIAQHCDALLALDAAAEPLREARRRCADIVHVQFEQMTVPMQWPIGTFDLVLLSEVVYYLSADDVGRLAYNVGNSLTSRGDVLLVHWTGETDYPLSGDDAAELFVAAVANTMLVVRRDRYPEFRLDVLTRR
jgi:2-polyprenyl-3-methyl-5-hydroxy-6-metoxy-1,4-benzoquinol methylase